MKSGSPWTLLVLLVAAPVPAQQFRVDRLASVLAAAAPGSCEWLERGCELVEAQWDFDVRLAMRTAADLWAVAVKSDVPGAAATAAAVMARVVIMADGPARADEWQRRAAELPSGTPSTLRAFYFVSRARASCACGNHVDEVAYVAQARAAAKATGDVVHRVRAWLAGHHSNASHNAAVLRGLLDEANAAGRGADVEHLLAYLYLEEWRAAEAVGDREAAAAAEATLTEWVARHDSPRVKGDLLLAEGNRLFAQRKADQAIAAFRQVAERMAKVGDLAAHDAALRAQAVATMQVGDFDAAADLLDECDQLLSGSGAMAEQRAVAGLRLDLAKRMADPARVQQWQAECARLDAESDEIAHRAAEAHERARVAEAERVEAETRLADAQMRTRAFGILGLAVALAVVAVVSWRSRRRLLLANANLAEQIREVEQSRIAQAQLEERMRLLERTETLGTMAAGVAHDFNNLLTSILGNAELLTKSRDSEVGELAHTVLLAGEQASRLCRQLQSYAGGSPTKRGVVDLVAMTREMLPSLHAALRGRVEVQLLAGDGAVNVVADRAQMEQVVLNLVVNARDARASNIRIQVGQRADENDADVAVAMLAVIDDGDGMTQEVQQRIFDPFFTTRFPGRGLGLAVVHGVVRRHAGAIHVRSEPGAGSQFTIDLPCASAVEPAVLIPPPPVEPGHLPPDVAVIAVDDDAAVRMLLARFFDRLSAHALVVENGAAAIDAVAGIVATRRVVVFVDLTMPEMDGVEVVRRLQELRADARIVVMSGHPPAYVEQVARGIGVDHVLAKPFTVDSLRAMLAALAREVAPGAVPRSSP